MGTNEGWQYDCRDRDGHALPSWRYPINEFRGRVGELRRAQRLRPAHEVLERLRDGGVYGTDRQYMAHEMCACGCGFDPRAMRKMTPFDEIAKRVAA